MKIQNLPLESPIATYISSYRLQQYSLNIQLFVIVIAIAIENKL